MADLMLRREKGKWRVGVLHYRHRAFNFLELTQPGGGVAGARIYSKFFIGGCVKPDFQG